MITELKLKWVKEINPDYKATLLEGESIGYPILWNFDDLEWNERNAQIVRDCGMLPIEMDNLLLVGWGYKYKDFSINLIFTQYKLTGFIEEDSAYYLKFKPMELIEFVIGKKGRAELIQCANKFYKEISIG